MNIVKKLISLKHFKNTNNTWMLKWFQCCYATEREWNERGKKTSNKNKWMAKMEMHVFSVPQHTTRSDGSERTQELHCWYAADARLWYITIASCCHSTHRPIFGKRQNANVSKHIAPNCRPSFTLRFSIGWTLLLMPCSEIAAPIRPIQSDLLFDISIDSGKITDWINCVCAIVWSRRIFVWQFFVSFIIIYSFCLLFGVDGNKYLQTWTLLFLLFSAPM